MIIYKGSQKHLLNFIGSRDFLTDVNSIIESTGAVIDSDDHWMPKGSYDAKEAKLKDFLAMNFDLKLGNEIRSWWLAKGPPETNTPNLDFVSTCTIKNQKGLLLVEAKAHCAELENESIGKRLYSNSSPDSKANHVKIGLAIDETCAGINKEVSGVSISRDKCYQLSNRIAHAWWLAKKGIPVILLYLGFLKAEDMRDGKNRIFETISDWETCFLNHSKQVGVDKIVNKWINCGKSSFITILKGI